MYVDFMLIFYFYVPIHIYGTYFFIKFHEKVRQLNITNAK